MNCGCYSAAQAAKDTEVFARQLRLRDHPPTLTVQENFTITVKFCSFSRLIERSNLFELLRIVF